MYGYCFGDSPTEMIINYSLEKEGATEKVLIIKVQAMGVYSKKGEQLKIQPDISKDKELSNSKDLKRILNIKVEKKTSN